MGRIRTIKPEFTQDEELSELPCETHLLAAGLLCYADDEGYFNANPRLIKAAIFPVRDTSREIPEMLGDLSSIGYVRFGNGPDGKRYGHIVKFLVHQRVSHPTPSKISKLRIVWDDYGEIPEDSGEFRNDSALKGKEGNREREGNGKQGSDATPPRDGLVREIICAHPKSILRQLKPEHVRHVDEVAVFEAMCVEVREAQCGFDQAGEMMLERNKRFAADIPRSEWRFLKDIPEFYRSFDYRREPDDFTSSKGKQDGTRNGNSAKERHSANREAIARAAERRGVSGAPTVSGADG